MIHMKIIILIESVKITYTFFLNWTAWNGTLYMKNWFVLLLALASIHISAFFFFVLKIFKMIHAICISSEKEQQQQQQE